jgi:outer membrane protein assembly factor BamB
VEEGKVIAKMHNTDLVALDMNSGAIIWINKKAGDDPLFAGLGYSKGYVYSNVGRGSKVIIARFNINTGVENWTYESSNGKFFNDGTIFDMTPITVDRETGLIYAADRFNVMCIRPPK